MYPVQRKTKTNQINAKPKNNKNIKRTTDINTHKENNETQRNTNTK